MGKWCLYVEPEKIDECVLKIKNGVIQGKIKQAKTNIIQRIDGSIYEDKHPEHTGKHGVEFYVEDSTDIDEIKNLYKTLVELDIINQDENISFKPDVFTAYDINEYLIDSNTIKLNEDMELFVMIKDKLQARLPPDFVEIR
ncbi:MAG: DUF1917 domain-containing protein [Rickettsiaceae bacterium]|nr:DUF1917 domain-containing protein [Rickettsiaceae bacterium]